MTPLQFLRHVLLTSSFIVSLAMTGCSTSDSSFGYSGSAKSLGHKPGPRGFRTVVLDAGHGGSDSGAVRNGIREKDVALDVVRRVEQKLGNAFRVKVVRNGDYFVDLDDRVNRASRSGDAVLVSVHFNSGPSSLSGVETYYWRVDSFGLASRLHRAVGSVTPRDNNRGLVRRRLRLTRNPTIPCVLIECGYLSNRSEAALIRQASYRDRLAYAIAYAISAQASEGDGNIGPLPPPRWDPPSRGTDARDQW
ncbi:MAG: N-acetylmuramoyl-L-alanine amidase [Verrucomicrobiaceae bacterium]|nr:N-acetylmuramoyl-L-alanine amidase [Verrucomicrobiaceae bacterium]